MTMRQTLALAALAGAAALGPAVATGQDYDERVSIALGAMEPDGPASLGLLVSFNYGRRVSPGLRVGAEVQWYRRQHDAHYLLVGDAAAATGAIIESTATTQLFPLLGTADYFFPIGRGDAELFFGAGAGLDYLRVKHFPVGLAPGSSLPEGTLLREFTRNAAGIGWVVRAGFSGRPGRTVGAVFLEGFYKGSSIDADDDLRVGAPADVASRAAGFGFRVGFRF